MRILFVHQNSPGQYKHLLQHLAASRTHELVFLTQRPNTPIAGVRYVPYRPSRKLSDATHPYLHNMEAAVLNAQAVWRAAVKLKAEGFRPDLMIGHNGWGETLFLKDVFPEAPLLSYFEFFYRPIGSDLNFDAEYPDTVDTRLRTHILNTVNLLGLQCADWGQTPTRWQRDQYPARFHDMLSLSHEGIDTDHVKPDAEAWVKLKAKGARFRAGDEVITYVARNLEPYRGVHVFLRTLPEILRRRPKAQVLIVGGDEVSYGRPLPSGQTYRQKLLGELGNKLDMSRVHFLGRIPYELYLKVLQVSAVHVYLTYPFVLSWSMLEAMSAGCLVLGSRTAPVREVIRHGENGLLVDFSSSSEIADAIDAVLEHPDRMQALRAAARVSIVAGYDLKNICLPRQLQIIEDLVAGKRPPLIIPEARAPMPTQTRKRGTKTSQPGAPRKRER